MFWERMQAMTEELEVVALPQPSLDDTVNQRAAATTALCCPRPTAVPDSEIIPVIRGFAVQAYE
jgi:hypothetical protein